jgi:hypothetical protein
VQGQRVVAIASYVLLAQTAAVPAQVPRTPTAKVPVRAELRLIPNSAFLWLGIQNVSDTPRTVCIDGGSITVESAVGTDTGSQIGFSSPHGTPCSVTDTWHLVLPSERYFTQKSYTRGGEGAAVVRATLRVKVGGVDGLMDDAPVHEVTASLALPAAGR